MDMICHNAPGIQNQAFCFLTVPKAFDNNVFVLCFGKDINPANSGETDKINTILVMGFIGPAQNYFVV